MKRLAIALTGLSALALTAFGITGVGASSGPAAFRPGAVDQRMLSNQPW